VADPPGLRDRLRRAALRRARLPVPVRGRRLPGVRTAKTTLAAVLSYVVAQRLGTSPDGILAPLTALLVVQLTLYETVAHGWERVASVTSGVLLAVGVASLVGLTWWSLGAVVAVSLLVGRLLRLGPHLPEVAISAMLVLAVGGAGTAAAAAGRVSETLIGAAVGLAVNAVVAPPLYAQPAGEALGRLADSLAGLLRGLAAALRTGWSREAADHWLERARALGGQVAAADRALVRAEQSARLHPRSRPVREAQPRLRTALGGLEHVHVTLRSLCRALLDRTYWLPESDAAGAYGEDVRAALAAVADAAADALEAVATVARAAGPLPEARAEVERRLGRLLERRDRLAELLLVDPRADAAAWEQHGALLAAVDRLRVEVEAAIRVPEEAAWHPPRLSERQRGAVRRALAERRRRPGRRPPG